MTSTKCFDDRIDTPVSKKTKIAYRSHALKKYGLSVAAWIRMLMHRDFTAKDE